jgi:hypothetical protein
MLGVMEWNGIKLPDLRPCSLKSSVIGEMNKKQGDAALLMKFANRAMRLNHHHPR